MTATEHKPEVGKAYRGPDGVARWIIHKSTRGYLHDLWLDEDREAWYTGAHYRESDFPMGDEVAPPQPGESYTRIGVYGHPRTETA